MRCSEAMIAWNKNGEVEVGPWPDKTGWTKPYMLSGGACEFQRRALTEDKRLQLMFIDFNTIVVRDGVDPQTAHNAFLAIDEYRALISPDIDGADSE